MSAKVQRLDLQTRVQPAAATDADAWHATLELGFAQRAGCSRLVRRRHRGPLQVQRSAQPEDADVCHAYILHPPGGVVGGDSLEIDIDVADAAHAFVTTPAAAKFYRSGGRSARQRQGLRVAPGASLEWLPQESIFYAAARVDSVTRVELQADAAFIGWEITCLGRPAAGEAFDCGDLRQSFEIWRDGEPLWVERAHFAGGSALMQAPWGLAGCSVSGTLVCVTRQAGLVARVRDALDAVSSTGSAAATQMDEVLLCRYLGHHAHEARRCFTAAWQVLRGPSVGRQATVPRLWTC